MPTRPAKDSPSADWWVQTSDTQTLDRDGQPVGFRHQLMHGTRKEGKPGVGVDAGRKLRAQAAMLNSQISEAAQKKDSHHLPDENRPAPCQDH